MQMVIMLKGMIDKEIQKRLLDAYQSADQLEEEEATDIIGEPEAGTEANM